MRPYKIFNKHFKERDNNKFDNSKWSHDIPGKYNVMGTGSQITEIVENSEQLLDLITVNLFLVSRTT
jgi:hypothetical protein